MTHVDGLWVVVLAAGDGKRLAPLTRALYGRDLPKQFAVLDGRRSLLQDTVRRACRLVPPERIVVVVGADHEALARRQLAALPGAHVLVQPRNLGTGPGLLLPLAWLRAQAPGARVVVFPSDHHVARPAPLLRAVRSADAIARGEPHLVTLLGVPADEPTSDFGWILPGRRIHGAVRAVWRFVEKPDRGCAERLQALGGLWSTFIGAGRLGAWWRLARRHLPATAAAFEGWEPSIPSNRAGDSLRSLYGQMEAADFSRDVLQRAADLGVACVSGAGWADFGRPERVFEALRACRGLGPLMRRLGPHRAAAAAWGRAQGA